MLVLQDDEGQAPAIRTGEAELRVAQILGRLASVLAELEEVAIGVARGLDAVTPPPPVDAVSIQIPKDEPPRMRDFVDTVRPPKP